MILKYLHDWSVLAIYITFTNLLTCCCSNSWETMCLDTPRKPQRKKIKKSITAQPDRGIHLTREMGLKCQHLPRLSHIHQALTPFLPSASVPLYFLVLHEPSLTLSGSGLFVCFQSSNLDISSFLESAMMEDAAQSN